MRSIDKVAAKAAGKTAGMTRRQILQSSLAAGVSAGVSALLPGAAAAQTSGSAAGSVRVLTNSHWGAFEAIVREGRLTGVIPFTADSHPSPMIQNFPALVTDRTRIPQPMVREGWLRRRQDSDRSARGSESFVAMGWDEALDLVAEELKRVRAAHGHEAVFGGSYGWGSAGRLHVSGNLTNRFLALTGGYTGSVGNYSYGAGMVLLPRVLGSNQAISGPLTNWSVIAEHSDLVVLFGGAAFKNGQISWGGAGAHTTEPAMRAAHAAGVKFVAVNPVREDDAETVGADWLKIRPNTDTALMLALCHELLASGRADEAFLARCTVGWERVKAYLTGQSDGVVKSADWAATITEIPADEIRALAARMAGGRTMIMTAWSLQRADHGEQPWWATILLASVLGQIGLPGGGFGFSYTSTNGVGMPVGGHSFPSPRRGRNPVKRDIPVARIADMLLQPGDTLDFNGREITYPEIRYIHWAGGNPFHHHQDLNRLSRAWAVPETIVVQDPWWTATARRADIVLPVTTTLERNDIGASVRDRWVVAMKQAIAPVGQARNDFDILADLAERFDQRAAFTEDRNEMQWLRHIWDRGRQRGTRDGLEMPDFDTFWAEGAFEVSAGNEDFVFLADFRADPEGNRLRTPSGRIELFSEAIAGFGYADCPGHPAWLEPREWLGAAAKTEAAPLHLVSSHPRLRLHSQMDNAPLARAAKIAGREPVMIHPEDAAARGIEAGDVVEIFNARGRLLAGAALTERVRPGVIVVYEGAWLDRDPQRGLDRHGNPNMVTADQGASRLTQGCTAQSCLVQARRHDGPAPPVRAFEPPATV